MGSWWPLAAWSGTPQWSVWNSAREKKQPVVSNASLVFVPKALFAVMGSQLGWPDVAEARGKDCRAKGVLLGESCCNVGGKSCLSWHSVSRLEMKEPRALPSSPNHTSHGMHGSQTSKKMPEGISLQTSPLVHINDTQNSPAKDFNARRLVKNPVGGHQWKQKHVKNKTLFLSRVPDRLLHR